jgi:tetratricopeptide (TPR) repeat protein
VEVAALAEQGARLDQRRLAVTEDRVQADLDAGRGEGLVAELEGLVAAEPLRERLTGLLMVALYRSGAGRPLRPGHQPQQRRRGLRAAGALRGGARRSAGEPRPHQELDDRRGQAFSLSNLGNVHERQGRYQEALACQRESLSIRRDLGDRAGQASCLTALGIAHQRQGRHQDALDCLRESLAIRRELDDSYGQADSLRALGVTLRALGRPEEARAHWRRALAIFEQLQTTDADQVRALLGERTTLRQS